MASGVHGRIDLTVPSGGVSRLAEGLDFEGMGVGRCDDGRGRKVSGWMNRTLQARVNVS
jgi:hypothetical protein